jgi:spore maturation protein CgeB
VFRPQQSAAGKALDLVWVGNWGDGERSAELREFLVEPVRQARLRARVHGVRYPPAALAQLRAAGIEYGGWIPNFRTPQVFAAARCTVHVPRRYYARSLPGIPTIRVFEALACGIPLVCAPWDDCEQLFEPGSDFLCARDGAHMRELLETLRHEPQTAAALAAHGLATIRNRHTCAHRVEELLGIAAQLGLQAARAVPAMEV